nr:MAG TPA: hypothetical protein [Caudoviricetes sp.]
MVSDFIQMLKMVFGVITLIQNEVLIHLTLFIKN